MKKTYLTFKKISILLIDILLHAGLYSPLFMLPGYLPLLSLILFPLCIYLERKFVGCTFGELLSNKKFVLYPSFKTLFKTPVFIKPAIGIKRGRLLKIFLPIASILSFVLAEPLDSFNTSRPQTAKMAYVEELNCHIAQSANGKFSKGVLKLPRNGGNLPYQIYKIEDKTDQMSYSIQRSDMHSDWTRYPLSIIMKGAVYVILNDLQLDKIHSKESGSHQGNKSTVIRGMKNNQAELVRIVLFNKQIYKIQVTYPHLDVEKEQKAIDFIDSFTPKS
jgi:hypothetical protein